MKYKKQITEIIKDKFSQNNIFIKDIRFNRKKVIVELGFQYIGLEGRDSILRIELCSGKSKYGTFAVNFNYGFVEFEYICL